MRYADFANKSENFVGRILQERRAVFRHEFGAKDFIDSHDETSAYWGWAFTWDGAPANLAKGPARVSIEIDKAAPARRQVDCAVNIFSHIGPGSVLKVALHFRANAPV